MVDNKKTTRAQAKWDRIAPLFDVMSRFMDTKRGAEWYSKLWNNVRGPGILEIGVGTGKSFPFYRREQGITAIDFSRGMLTRAERKARRLGLPLTLKRMDVQKLEFGENTFDTVVASCVFCSVPDPVLGFQEIRRVLKPGGRLVVLEHMRHSNKIVGKAMDLINPIVEGLSGPAINRRTLDNILKAGMEIETVENLGFGGIMKLIIVRPAKNGQQLAHNGDRK